MDRHLGQLNVQIQLLQQKLEQPAEQPDELAGKEANLAEFTQYVERFTRLLCEPRSFWQPPSHHLPLALS